METQPFEHPATKLETLTETQRHAIRVNTRIALIVMALILFGLALPISSSATVAKTASTPSLH